MSLITTSLNSGSNGNCYYISNGTEAILVDAGLSCRETEKRMRALGLSMLSVKAVFISHEHTDHIKGLSVLAAKYKLPVHVSNHTLTLSGIKLDKQLVNYFVAGDKIKIGNMTVSVFAKFHDAADPHSFTVSYNKITIGVFTDIGRPCERLISHFKKCHAAYLETNYDEDMLENGSYPRHLKNRIRGGQGHLSNTQALDVFKTHRPPFMTHLFLSHLSKENNSPELVQQLFRKHAKGTNIVVASRYEPTAIYRIGHETGSKKPKHAAIPSMLPKQLSIFQ